MTPAFLPVSSFNKPTVQALHNLVQAAHAVALSEDATLQLLPGGISTLQYTDSCGDSVRYYIQGATKFQEQYVFVASTAQDTYLSFMEPRTLVAMMRESFNL